MLHVITTATSGGLQLGTGLKLGTSELIMLSLFRYVMSYHSWWASIRSNCYNCVR